MRFSIKHLQAAIVFGGTTAFPLLARAAHETKINRIISALTDTVRLLLVFTFTLALLTFFWFIVKLISAAQDPEKLKGSKGIISWGIIGLAVIASLSGIIIFLQSYFGIEGGGIIPAVQFPLLGR